jgi:hypothetical protein
MKALLLTDYMHLEMNDVAMPAAGPQWAVECGAAHGALAMTRETPPMATVSEVLQLMKGKSARIQR